MSRSSLRHQDVKIKSSFGEEGGGATDCYCSKPTLSSWLSFPVTLFRNSHSVWSVSTSPVCLARINSCDINCFLSGSLTKRNSATWSCNQHWVTLVVYHSSRHCSDVFAFFFPPAATITIWTAVTKKCQFIVGSDSQVVNIHFLSSHSISTNPASLPAQRVSEFQNGRWMIWLEFTPSHLSRCWWRALTLTERFSTKVLPPTRPSVSKVFSPGSRRQRRRLLLHENGCRDGIKVEILLLPTRSKASFS